MEKHVYLVLQRLSSIKQKVSVLVVLNKWSIARKLISAKQPIDSHRLFIHL
jgi:hypothetical protein